VVYNDGPQHGIGAVKKTMTMHRTLPSGSWSTPVAVMDTADTEYRNPTVGLAADGDIIIQACKRGVSTPGIQGYTQVRIPAGGDEGDADTTLIPFSPQFAQLGAPTIVDGKLIGLGNSADTDTVKAALSSDDGDSWTQQSLFVAPNPDHLVEWRGVALDSDRAIFLGRGNEDGGVWQVNYDSGVFATRQLTNIDDAHDQPVWVERIGSTLHVWYSSRADPYLRHRSAPMETVWGGPTAWGEGVVRASGIAAENNCGYVSAATDDTNTVHLAWYAGAYPGSVAGIYYLALPLVE
jgi:hypothetical protein